MDINRIYAIAYAAGLDGEPLPGTVPLENESGTNAAFAGYSHGSSTRSRADRRTATINFERALGAAGLM